MNIDSCAFLPEARREGIIAKEVDGELLVYDRTRDKAHCLNRVAAAIWKHCNGRTTPSEIVASLEKEMHVAIDEQIVWLGLDQLRRLHLLEKVAWPPKISRLSEMSRREAIRRIGLGAAIALPIVVSITVPTPAEAAVSCGATCHPCNSPIDCCGVCTSSVPGCPGAGNKCT